MPWFHRHKWQEVSRERSWVFPHSFFDHDDHGVEAGPFRLFQDKRPSPWEVTCRQDSIIESWYPTPETVIVQICDVCKKYRTQYVESLMNPLPTPTDYKEPEPWCTVHETNHKFKKNCKGVSCVKY